MKGFNIHRKRRVYRSDDDYHYIGTFNTRRIAYKKVYLPGMNCGAPCRRNQGVIAVLRIPTTSLVVRHDDCDKMRTEAAEVVCFETCSGKRLPDKVAFSGHDAGFIYVIGEVVKPKCAFNKNPTEDCGSGIHFYLNRKRAAAH